VVDACQNPGSGLKRLTKTAKNLSMDRDLAQTLAKYLIKRGIKIPKQA